MGLGLGLGACSPVRLPVPCPNPNPHPRRPPIPFPPSKKPYCPYLTSPDLSCRVVSCPDLVPLFSSLCSRVFKFSSLPLSLSSSHLVPLPFSRFASSSPLLLSARPLSLAVLLAFLLPLAPALGVPQVCGLICGFGCHFWPPSNHCAFDPVRAKNSSSLAQHLSHRGAGTEYGHTRRLRTRRVVAQQR